MGAAGWSDSLPPSLPPLPAVAVPEMTRHAASTRTQFDDMRKYVGIVPEVLAGILARQLV
jgi:hypothetical protein